MTEIQIAYDFASKDKDMTVMAIERDGVIHVLSIDEMPPMAQNTNSANSEVDK